MTEVCQVLREPKVQKEIRVFMDSLVLSVLQALLD